MDKNNQIPKHVAIIMDGNRRWAKSRGLAEVEGHRQGVSVIKPIIKKAIDLGVEVITFWAFATKNFERDKSFLKDIMQVFRETLDKKDWFEEIKQAGGRINVIGQPKRFPTDIIKKLNNYLQQSQPEQEKIIVNFALEYEGRDEIIRGIKKMLKKIKAGNFSEKQLNIESFAQFLDTAGQPDPDLIIRTSGEKRLSGYLLWQMADAELFFTSKLWPDFDVSQFELAIEEYLNRERRFGR